MKYNSVLKSTIAGSWYPGDPVELEKCMESLLGEKREPSEKQPPAAILTPHAGYDWSGSTAAFAYKTVMGATVRRVILLAPSHRVYLQDTAVLPESGAASTPLGEIPFDTDAMKKLLDSGCFQESDSVHRNEHSTQIQYPFLQVSLGKFQLIPIIVGILSPAGAKNIAKALRPLLGPETLLVVSSDFIHYGTDFEYTPFRDHAPERTRELNERAWELIRTHAGGELRKFEEETGATICGIHPIYVLLDLLPENAEGHLLHYATSLDSAPSEHDRFVCYLAADFTVSDSESPLSETDKKALLGIARAAIEYVFEHNKLPPRMQFEPMATEASKKAMGAFVTLKTESGDLRGCIGEIEPCRPLWQAVAGRACDAAFRDPRFYPLTPEEFPCMTIEISALTPAHAVGSWRDIVVGKHGMTLEKDGRAAVFLPQVAPEQGWTIEETLTQLSCKAGLPPGAWREKDASFTVFEAIVFSGSARK